ncbi:uncharacterized protein LOC133835041 [Drosophila sulfurigaster albostrigata]|uniref:uncharacterized protein LOC133835041 n=1 Tax=Drosophila sulfurigaster albostrigata TaxID=89887 RepID=UPI002D21C251|nr:uncharacterized protein LOC133835041 [Drosophila sulfurigaster albostrigata]
MPPDDVMHCVVRELFPTTAGETVRNLDVATSNNSAAIELVTSAEISTIAGSMKLGKAPGPDGIPLRALRLACALRPEIFVDMFNRCLQEAVFPDIWKSQRLVLLLNQARIRANLLHIGQSASLTMREKCWRKSSTVDAATRVVEIASHAIAGSRWKGGAKEYCLMVTLDIKNAFNSARWDCILKALAAFQVPRYLLEIAYLPHRRGGKLLEKVICTRLEEAILVNGNLSPNQYGFRKARSTVDAIEKVVGIASNAIAGTRWKGGQKKYCLMVTLDIRNAFNSARWNCILRALDAFKVPRQLLKIIRSYFSSRVLKYDTSDRTEEYIVTGGVPQGSVLGPLLWNAMYDGILRLDLPTGANLIGFADDIALLVVAKELEVAESNCNRAIDCIGTWLLSVGLELAPHKTEAVLISSRNKVETAVVKVGAAHITSKRTLKYLGVTIDSMLSFREHLQEVGHAVIKSSHIGGLASTFRLSAIRVISGFRTVSDEAAHVIAGIPPFEETVREREWTTRSHGQLNFHLTQVISGHGCFRSYLFRFGHDTAEECPACFPTAVEDAEHVIFQCGRYATLRQELADAIGERLTVSTLVPLMLVSSTNWTLISQFVAAVMNEQRRAEKARQRTRE